MGHKNLTMGFLYAHLVLVQVVLLVMFFLLVMHPNQFAGLRFQ
jgi:hypothetical protein